MGQLANKHLFEKEKMAYMGGKKQRHIQRKRKGERRRGQHLSSLQFPGLAPRPHTKPFYRDRLQAQAK